MIKHRNRTVVIRNQFNIHGSRGQDAGKFIADYVSRETATEPSLAYHPKPNTPVDPRDGVAFTLDETAISRSATLEIAEHVQTLHATNVRAIQQMVISFEPQYLIDQKIVDDDTTVFEKGDYAGNYDDVRLRNAVRAGLQSLIDMEGYRDGKAIGCIQWDTQHLHVHAVVYEDAKQISRMRGGEEKGVIKPSSFNQMAYDMNRRLTLTKTNGRVITKKTLYPTPIKRRPIKPVSLQPVQPPHYINQYLLMIQQSQQVEQSLAADEQAQTAERIAEAAALTDDIDAPHLATTSSVTSNVPTSNQSVASLADSLADSLAKSLNSTVNSQAPER